MLTPEIIWLLLLFITCYGSYPFSSQPFENSINCLTRNIIWDYRKYSSNSFCSVLLYLSNCCQIWHQRVFSPYRAILDQEVNYSLAKTIFETRHTISSGRSGPASDSEVQRPRQIISEQLEESVIFRAVFVFVLLQNNNPCYLTFYQLRSKFNSSGKCELSWVWNFVVFFCSPLPSLFSKHLFYKHLSTFATLWPENTV